MAKINWGDPNQPLTKWGPILQVVVDLVMILWLSSPHPGKGGHPHRVFLRLVGFREGDFVDLKNAKRVRFGEVLDVNKKKPSEVKQLKIPR